MGQNLTEKHMDLRASLPEHPVPANSTRGELRVDGLVERPLALRPADVAHLERVEVAEPFTCEEGWQTPTLTWRGVRLLDVLQLAGPRAGAAWVRVSAGEYALPLPLKDAAGAVLAERLNGEALTIEHGGPWRLVLPGGSCFTSVKWVDRLEVAVQAGDASGERIARARLSRNG
jgi:DMSO/TMAO reductase YedYZ molybdopterin-dependent catalytic subunit